MGTEVSVVHAVASGKMAAVRAFWQLRDAES